MTTAAYSHRVSAFRSFQLDLPVTARPSCTPHNQHFHFWLPPVAGKIALSSKTTGQKRSDLVHFGSCHYVIEYFMRDMMNYHCLRVFRRRVKRIGKLSPGFSMFRTRVHGCSDAELCCVPIQNKKQNV